MPLRYILSHDLPRLALDLKLHIPKDYEIVQTDENGELKITVKRMSLVPKIYGTIERDENGLLELVHRREVQRNMLF